MIKLDDLVGQYIQLRDKKAQMKADYEGKVSPVQNLMDKVEARLLEMFQAAGIDSIKTSNGTAYTSTRTSATIADWDAYLTHVKRNEAWELLERRCNKTAAEQVKAATGELPPGINWREERTVNIRRS